MENYEVWFRLIGQKEFDDEIKTHNIDFVVRYDEDGNECDWQSRNPCSTWTNYNNWHDNWKEQDDDLEVILEGIKEASNDDDLFNLIACIDEDDIGKIYDIGLFGDEDIEIKTQIIEVWKFL